jgi:RNA polymerase sigma factor FliA
MPTLPPRSATPMCRGNVSKRSTRRRIRGRKAVRATEPVPMPDLDVEQAAEVERLWTSYKDIGTNETRDQLILHYSPLVKYVAGRVGVGLPPNIEQADLVSYGIFGLIDAIEKFDLERAIKFETYAIPRIKGAIIDELRAMDWVPRSIRFKAREIERAYADVEAKKKRAPTEAEIATHLGIGVGELHEMVSQISFVSVMALDEVVTAGEDRGEGITLLDTLSDRGDPTSGLEGQETRGMLAAAINSLSEREKIVVTLYYFEGMTLAEIGEILGVTESRVCQIHTKSVALLRGQLTETPDI